MSRKFQELEDRVISFTLRAIEVSEVLPTKVKLLIKLQIIWQEPQLG
jgi:hypothetical protein